MNPTEHLFFIIFFGFLIALCSCTQDISIDALRIEQVNEGENKLIAAGASVAVVGWWTGFKLGGLLSLSISDYFSRIGFYNYWQITFILIIFLILLFNLFLLKIEEKLHRSKQEYRKFEKYFRQNILNSIIFKKYFTWLASTVLIPIISFFKKNGLSISIYLILFILLFKVGEAFLGRMSVIFYKEIGFSKTDIAIFSKGIGWITTISFTLLGGILTIKMGLLKAIFVSGIFMALTNLCFSILFWYDQSYLLFIVSIVLDDIAAAFATVAFVTFISALVDRNFTATQYALLASIGTIGRTILASSSGSLVDYLNGNWGIFFVLTTIMVFPSLLILILIKNKIKNL